MFLDTPFVLCRLRRRGEPLSCRLAFHLHLTQLLATDVDNLAILHNNQITIFSDGLLYQTFVGKANSCVDFLLQLFYLQIAHGVIILLKATSSHTSLISPLVPQAMRFTVSAPLLS